MDEPENPDQPENPDEPENSDKPENPDQSDEPENPDEPGKPDEFESPFEPERTDEPEISNGMFLFILRLFKINLGYAILDSILQRNVGGNLLTTFVSWTVY